MAHGWRYEVRVGPAGELHGSWPTVESDHTVRALALCRPVAPAVVLGSTQPDGVVDVAASHQGPTVVRRRSGGGAVFVEPGNPVWLDVWIPVGDPLWKEDVSHSFWWLGQVWADALTSMGVRDLVVHHQASGGATRWAGTVCFAGIGAGEVTTISGVKVVGLAQRRTRRGAWFTGACALRWQPGPLVDLLALGEDDRVRARVELAGVAAGVRDLLANSSASTDEDLELAVVRAFRATLATLDMPC